jgi:Tfp pilus assembly protein PilO
VSGLHGSSPVPVTRVLREHRAALLPLAVVLVLNILVLVVGVLPLAQRASSNESRAAAAERAQTVAAAELTRAEAARDGTSRASTDLDTFHDKVLPADLAAARRLLHVRFQQKAREYGVRFERSAADEEHVRESRLDRLTSSMTLSGDYEDIRALLYDLESAPDFFIIDNVSLSEGDPGKGALSLALTVSTYYRTTRTVPDGR